MAQTLVFVGIMLAVVGPIHWYIWRRMVRDTTTPGRWRRVGTITVVALAGSLLAALILPQVFGAKDTWVIALIGYLWLAVLFYLLVALVVLEIPRFIAIRATRSRAGTTAVAPSTESPELAKIGGGAEQSGAPGHADAPVAGQSVATSAAEAPSAGQPVDATVAGPPATDADPAGSGSPDTSRRLFIARSAAIVAGLTAVGVTGYGVKTALGPPQIRRLQIPLAKLPRGMDGYRIALVSDIHLGPLTGIEHTRRIVSTINGLNADLIAVVGDMVDGSVAELGAEAAPLAGLSSRDGAYFVTGNHEYYSGVDEWIAEVRRLGMRPLQNERLSIRGIDLAGVNDVTGDQFGTDMGPDFDKTFDDRDPSKPVILLAHQPVQAYEAAKHGVDLQLSGHTHGGQMVPFNLIAALQQPVISGLGEVDGTKVFVTNGAGYWGPPVRVGAPPDVSLVELRTV